MVIEGKKITHNDTLTIHWDNSAPKTYTIYLDEKGEPWIWTTINYPQNMAKAKVYLKHIDEAKYYIDHTAEGDPFFAMRF